MSKLAMVNWPGRQNGDSVALWTQSSQRIFRFDAFEVDVLTGELRKHRTRVKLQEQPFKILAMLLARPGELVTRMQLQEGLWSNDTFVDFDRGLNTAINRLRAALSDSADTPRFVETVGRRGYRFIASVTTHNPGQEAIAGEPSPSSSRIYEWPSGNNPPSDSSGEETSAAVHLAAVVPAKSKRPAVILAAILIAAGAIGYSAYRLKLQSFKPTFENLEITKLTYNGKAENAAISPDGRYVAYLFRDGERTSLRLRQSQGSGEAQVVVHEALLVPGLTFSADGNELYFLRGTSDNPLYKDLYAVPSLGGPIRKVRSNVDSPISFSPDGRQFVYERGVPKLGSVEIRVGNTDGSGDRLLVNLDGAIASSMPGAAWSPDGKSIAVPLWMLHQQPANVLDVVSAADGSVRKLFASDQDIGRPQWLPDGNALVVPMNVPHERRTQLWIVYYPAGKVRRLTNDLADYDAGLDLTRDGKMLATIQWTRIANLSAGSIPAGSESRQLTFDEQHVYSVFPVDDGRIAFINRSDNGLWMMNADGSHRTLVATVPETNWFTSCGRYFLFESSNNSTWDLMRFNQDGTDALRLSSGLTWGAICSPDRKFVYYAEALTPGFTVRRIPIDGGKPVDIVVNPGESITGRVAISPDGKLLAFPYSVSSTERMKIAVVPITGGPMVKQFEVPGDVNGSLSGSLNGPRWSPDGRTLQYLLEINGANNMWAQPIDGGSPRQVTKFSTGQIFDFNWTADGKQLLLSRGEVTSDVVLLENRR